MGGNEMADLQALMTWTFNSEVATPPEVLARLIPGETAWVSYKTIRDTATVTNKRIIIADKQGIMGNKIEVYTIPFKSIVMYSTENAGSFLDFNAELEMWTKAGKFKLNLAKGIDVAKLDKLVAAGIFGSSD
jgi:hypothetical protein